MRLGLISCVVLASAWVACSPPPPATLEFVDQSPANPRLGEITTLRFRAIDSRGNPQAGTPVHFALQSPVPSVTLTPEDATTNVGDGVASTQVVASGRVASVVVVASSGDKVALSPAVGFAGAGANGRQFTFQCGSFSGNGSGGLHAIGAFDETRYLIAGVKVVCTAHVGDRNGDGVAGAQVSFLTEAGTVGPTATSVTDVVGNAQILYKTSYPLPVPTDPGTFTWNPTNDATHTGDYLAPLWMHPFFWVQNPIKDYGNPNTSPQVDRPEPFRDDPLRPGLRNNPRDNLVAMIAVTTGEEGFNDKNNNGQFDEGEFDPRYDLTEPFVDSNDNGTWDDGELFVDAFVGADGRPDGKWNGKNGKYDASTLIWVQERLLWTGWPHPLDRDETPFNGRPVVRQIKPAVGVPLVISHFGYESSTFLLSDPWFNRIAQNAEGDGCSGGNIGPVDVSNLPKGVAFTYPSLAIETYTIRDQHDPNNDPTPPPYNPAVRFEVNASCTYTASQEDGHAVIVSAPTITGTVL